MTLSSRLVITLALLVLTASAGVTARERGQDPSDKRRPFQAEFPPSDNIASRLQQGLNSKRADRLLREDPFGVSTIEALVSCQREDDALRAARQIFDRYPDRIARVLDALARIIPGARGDVPGREERLQEMLAHARARAAVLARPERADAAYALMRAEASLLRSTTRSRTAYSDALKKVVEEHAGTPAALEAEVSLIDQAFYDDRGQSLKHQEELLAFARSHEGTVAGARALYLAAFHVASNADMLNLAPRGGGGDPTERFLLLLDLVRELQDGRYPKCQATDDGDRLVIGFYAYKPAYAPENMDRLLAAVSALRDDALDAGRGQLRPERDRLPGHEQDRRVLQDQGGGHRRLRAVPDRARGEGARPVRGSGPAGPVLPDDDGIRTAGGEGDLAREGQAGSRGHSVRGHGVLPAQGDGHPGGAVISAARVPGGPRRVRPISSGYPESPYAWVAAIRIGQCDQLTGDWASALAWYQNVPPGGDAAPVPRVLADILSARALEALGDPAKALGLFRQALGRWDPVFGEVYDAGGPPETRPVVLPSDINPEFRASRLDLEARIAQLERTTAAPGAVPLERARWLLRAQRWQEALKAAGQVVTEFSTSPNAAEARYLGHRAQLEEALERADVEKPGANPRAAVEILERLSGQPLDFAVCVADVARAYLSSGGGASPEGEKLLLEALATWRARQGPAASLDALEQDVANIRTLVFHPNGDAIYAGTRWNGFAWPSQPFPFVVAVPEVRVRLSDGTVRRLSFAQRFPHLDNVLSFDQEQIGLLNTLMTRLGGTKAREGQIFFDKGYMEAPNQPVGPSLSVMAFLRKAFPVMPGHWGGWHFATFPTVDELLFLDDARSRALARVRVGYAGGDLLLEKQGGAWRATKLTQTWVE